eukprot:Hpha_TRINITY_DN14125_c0_g1::TRINITY_DN14125_c0_g1_i1::g.11010::m.11010/K14803/PTC2_3; protein phosphatase PTC2/3
MSGSPRQGGFKNFLSDGAKEQKKKGLAILRKKAQESGSFLDAPVKTPETDTSEHSADGRTLHAAQCSVQGWRRANEDAQTVILSLPKHPSASFLGVFDGHGGASVARCVAAKLHGIVDANLPDSLDDGEAIGRALQKSFFEMDDLVDKELTPEQSSSTGATCNVIILTKDLAVCGNAGDARAILVSSDGTSVALSKDHAPDSPGEKARIQRAGSYLTEDGRIDGMLNVSRAMGDFDFKRKQKNPEDHAVTCAADIVVHELKGSERAIVQACDGIWGAKDSDEVAAFISKRLDAGDPPLGAACALCEACLAPELRDDGNGTDNMSVNVCTLGS